MTAALENLLRIQVQATEAAVSPAGPGSPACPAAPHSRTSTTTPTWRRPHPDPRPRVQPLVLGDLGDGNRPVVILDGRQAGDFADWLRAHPGARVIYRDRASGYADCARQGAPEARQVADRWHPGDNPCHQPTRWSPRTTPAGSSPSPPRRRPHRRRRTPFSRAGRTHRPGAAAHDTVRAHAVAVRSDPGPAGAGPVQAEHRPPPRRGH